MINYLLRRLILLPITLFCIILINFIIINLAPGEPSTLTEISPEGAAVRKEDRSVAFGNDDRYLQFREFYGLTLPIIFNTWPELTQSYVDQSLRTLITHKISPTHDQEMSLSDYDAIKIKFGDQSRFIMPKLLNIMEQSGVDLKLRRIATRFFIRGGTRQAYLGPNLTQEEKKYNKKIDIDNNKLAELAISPLDSLDKTQEKIISLRKWYDENKAFYNFEPSLAKAVIIFFVDTRFYRYMSRVISLNFGTLRNDNNKTVLKEVVKRFKYSLTLAIIPMLVTFILCQIFGFIMAYQHNHLIDHTLNLFFLILYAIPVFVVAPFLIEIALNHTFPFSHIPIPMNGFTSSDAVYAQENSIQRLFDVIQHICLPLIAVMYGSLAAQTRLSRTAVLEVLRNDYVRTAKAKGLSKTAIMFKHVGRNAAITIVTSIAGSLGVVLGGSLIVETLFGINGFGKFFYDAILNRDYNVIMFSALAGSFLSLVGFLVADIAYTCLDPRVTLE